MVVVTKVGFCPFFCRWLTKVDNKHVLLRRAPRHKITKHGKVRYSLHSRTFTRQFEIHIYSLRTAF